jgi:hypothetical protein
MSVQRTCRFACSQGGHALPDDVHGVYTTDLASLVTDFPNPSSMRAVAAFWRSLIPLAYSLLQSRAEA